MRKHSAAGHALSIQASKAGANAWASVQIPYSTPEMFKVIDMVYENSVIAEYNKFPISGSK
jgi:hypothetical protein